MWGDKGQTRLGKCAYCFRARSVNPLVYSGLLQTGESTGSLLSCSIALTVLLTSEGPGGNHHCPALSCAQSGGGQRLGGSQRETGGGLCPSWWAVVTPVCLRKQFSKSSVGILRGSLRSCFPASGMGAGWISTDLFLRQSSSVLGGLSSSLLQGAGSGTGAAGWRGEG